MAWIAFHERVWIGCKMQSKIKFAKAGRRITAFPMFAKGILEPCPKEIVEGARDGLLPRGTTPSEQYQKETLFESMVGTNWDPCDGFQASRDRTCIVRRRGFRS